MSAAPTASTAGAFRTIKGYELREKIGEGGFGSVYRAFQPSIQREVALKMIRPDMANEEYFIRSFESEAQTIARLEHPYIVPLFEYWRDPDGAYLVMRWIRGGSLRKLLDARALTLLEISQILQQITSALHVAHRNEIVHRDLKPDNILIDEDGNAYLTDFGIARPTGGVSTNDNISGSIQYVSPEELQNQPCTPQTDIYSLGIMLYEMLMRQHPFAGCSIGEMYGKHLSESLPIIHLIDPNLPAAFDTILQKATEKNPTNRYQDIRDLAADFHRALTAHDPEASTQEMLILSGDEVHNPYKGLRPFSEADAGDFYGRGDLITRLVERLSEDDSFKRFLAVIGSSGSGKSSVVLAGLVPALRQGEVIGSHNWFIVTMVPGAQPLRKLEAALLSIALKPPKRLYDQLRADSHGLLWAVDRVLGDATGDCLLVIDQFEELFTQLDDPAERDWLLKLLRTAVTASDSRLRLVITMRADFMDQALASPELGELLQRRTEFVLPMSPVEIEQAIVMPARRVGISVKPDLIAAAIADIQSEPGALPLLQYALTETFERRDGTQLTLAAYQASGGVIGALARRADEVYSTFDEDEQQITRQIFLRLVTVGEHTDDTRRRARRTELLTISGGDLNQVIDSFGKYRLLTFDYEIGTREPTIEIAHEALISHWGLLRRWINLSREDMRLQRQLATAALEWRNSGNDISFLLRGARLQMFETWQNETTLNLTTDEHEYLDESITERTREAASETARRRREMQLVIDLEHQKQEAESAIQQAENAKQAAQEAEAVAYRTAEYAIETEKRAHTAQRRAALGTISFVVIALLALATVFWAVRIRSDAESTVAAAQFEATYFNLKIARDATLIPGVGIPPTAQPNLQPLDFIATVTQVAVVYSPVIVNDSYNVAMVEVPAGCFVMGSSDQTDESPTSERCFDVSFRLDQYEVTNTQFTALGGIAAQAGEDGDQFPRVNLTWGEANAFCALRGARLPTEAEWEYAARGLNSLKYTYGKDKRPLREVYGEDFNQLLPVGSTEQERSWVGAYDLLGNVSEWVSSLYMSYPYRADDGREDLTVIGDRVLRGASYFSVATDRAADRSFFPPDTRYPDVGFRCAS